MYGVRAKLVVCCESSPVEPNESLPVLSLDPKGSRMESVHTLARVNNFARMHGECHDELRRAQMRSRIQQQDGLSGADPRSDAQGRRRGCAHATEAHVRRVSIVRLL